MSDIPLEYFPRKTITSEDLIIPHISLEDDSVSSTLSGASSTTISWIPSGLSGKVLHALGPSTVNLVKVLLIKKRISSISSQIDVRLHTEGPLSEDETEQLRVAHRDLVELSSGLYKAKITTQATVLRLTLLRTLIQNERSCLNTYWNKYTMRSIWAELDNVASGSYDPDIRDTAAELRHALVTKVIDELSNSRTLVHAKDLGTILAGTNIVTILCHDLAHGSGRYAVQGALYRISRCLWGACELEILDRQGDIVSKSVGRLLVEFDNNFSRGMAFKIFGDVASKSSLEGRNNLMILLSGSYGLDKLIDEFSSLIDFHWDSYYVRCSRNMEVLCVALMSACCHGFAEEIIRKGMCPLSIELLEALVARDKIVRGYLESEGTEDADTERGQTAFLKLLLKLLEVEDGKQFMLADNGADIMESFGKHPNRAFSGWYLIFLVGAIRQKLG